VDRRACSYQCSCICVSCMCIRFYLKTSNHLTTANRISATTYAALAFNTGRRAHIVSYSCISPVETMSGSTTTFLTITSVITENPPPVELSTTWTLLVPVGSTTTLDTESDAQDSTQSSLLSTFTYVLYPYNLWQLVH
jgi:hypothetical protein